MAEPFEVSAMHVAGMVKVLDRLGYTARVQEKVSGATRAALERPYDARWHPGAVLVEVSDAVIALEGGPALETMTYEMTKSSFGPVLRPVISVALALTGNDPASVFSRVRDSLKVAMRGVDVHWDPDGKQAGALSLTYPMALPADAVASWRGVVRFLFELSKHPEGQLAHHELVNGARTLKLRLEW